MKKYVMFMVAAVMLVSMVTTVYASPNDDVIKALKDAGVPEIYIIQTENYLKTRDLTADESAAVIEQIKIADKVMKDAGTKDAAALSTADKNKILAAVAKAGEAIGLTITIDKDSDGTYTIIGLDKDGREVANFTTKEVKQTGGNYMLAYMGAAILLAAVISVIGVKRYVVAKLKA